jgi:large subunit ribosomal protein L17
MRHLKAGRKLGRNASHRLALMRNLARALFEHGRIITTVEKAKELRPFAEKLITLAKKGTLHARRLVLARLGPATKAAYCDEKGNPTGDSAYTKLFDEIAPRFADRPGGYTRIIKRHDRRLGDGGRTAFIELLREGERKVQARAPAPAPRVSEPLRPAPAPAPPPPAPAPEASASPPESAPTPEASAPLPAAPESSAAPPAEGTPPAS